MDCEVRRIPWVHFKFEVRILILQNDTRKLKTFFSKGYDFLSIPQKLLVTFVRSFPKTEIVDALSYELLEHLFDDVSPIF